MLFAQVELLDKTLHYGALGVLALLILAMVYLAVKLIEKNAEERAAIRQMQAEESALERSERKEIREHEAAERDKDRKARHDDRQPLQLLSVAIDKATESMRRGEGCKYVGLDGRP